MRLVLLLAGGVLVASCTSSPGDANRDARILHAEVRGESVTLTLDVCDAEDNRADVAVQDDEVVITVATDARPGAEGCGDVLEVELPEPLAGRPIVDGSTGDQVSLTLLD